MIASRIIKGAGSKGSGSSWQPFDWAAPEEKPVAYIPIPQEEPEPAQGSVSLHAMEEYTGQAYERGYREGEAAVRSAYEEATNAVSRELARTVSGLAQLRSSIYRSSQADLLRLSMAIARRILRREILMSADVLQGIIAVVLEKLGRQEIYRVRVHPEMVKRVEEHLRKLAEGRAVQVAGDPSLPPGGCVFQTGRGDVDAGVESQLAEVERGLADHLEQQS